MPDVHRHAPEEIVCREFVELVTDFLDGALPEERVELVEEHLIMCDWCLTYLRQFEETVRALPATPEAEAVAPETHAALLGAFREWTAGR